MGLGSSEHLDGAVTPRGYRLLAKVPRLPGAVVDRLVDHFGSLQKLLAATIDDLQAVEGVGETRARSVTHDATGACDGFGADGAQAAASSSDGR